MTERKMAVILSNGRFVVLDQAALHLAQVVNDAKQKKRVNATKRR